MIGQLSWDKYQEDLKFKLHFKALKRIQITQVK